MAAARGGGGGARRRAHAGAREAHLLAARPQRGLSPTDGRRSFRRGRAGTRGRWRRRTSSPRSPRARARQDCPISGKKPVAPTRSLPPREALTSPSDCSRRECYDAATSLRQGRHAAGREEDGRLMEPSFPAVETRLEETQAAATSSPPGVLLRPVATATASIRLDRRRIPERLARSICARAASRGRMRPDASRLATAVASLARF